MLLVYGSAIAVVPLLGLGVAVDSSLLVVVRWRAERQQGLSNEEAILAAGRHAGKAVLLSGAVAVGLLALVVLPVPFLRSIGFGGMLIPLVALAAALTLLPVTLALISALTFLILARAFRSVVFALKAVLLNVVSLGSAFGFIVLFWQQGHGSSLFYGTPATAAIRDWIPIVVFACLFGLSRDYEVFLLSRIREEYDRSRSTSGATVTALAHTGRLVTCAALILAASFLSLSTNPNELVRIVATALAAGVLVDALVVRTLLVPALVVLLGRWNWWMPSALGRLLGLTAIPIDSEHADVV
jgi:uncharacterized membrane protein YdfJ with MMPL/SSD domain